MSKQNIRKGNVSRAACMALVVMIAAPMAVSGCSKRGSQIEKAEIETEAPMELHLSCYLTGTNTFTDAEGKEQTSVRFLVENDDTTNKDWVKGINGREFLRAGKEEVQIYSRYINDNCRYVDGTIPGHINSEDVIYSAGDFICGNWKQAGDGQYKEIGAIVEDGIPYFYTGCGVSTGLAGERMMCVWLAGFTPDSMPVDGERPQITKADRFSLVTADGKELLDWEGMAKEPELSANEFGIEVSIQAKDADMLMRSVASTGLLLRHEGTDGTVTDFELEKKMEGEILEASEPVEDEEAIRREECDKNVGSGNGTKEGVADTENEKDTEDAVDAENAETGDSGKNTEGATAPETESGVE